MYTLNVLLHEERFMERDEGLRMMGMKEAHNGETPEIQTYWSRTEH